MLEKVMVPPFVTGLSSNGNAPSASPGVVEEVPPCELPPLPPPESLPPVEPVPLPLPLVAPAPLPLAAPLPLVAPAPSVPPLPLAGVFPSEGLPLEQATSHDKTASARSFRYGIRSPASAP